MTNLGNDINTVHHMAYKEAKSEARKEVKTFVSFLVGESSKRNFDLNKALTKYMKRFDNDRDWL